MRAFLFALLALAFAAPASAGWVWNPYTGKLDATGSGTGGTGNVVGPASSTTNALAAYASVSGQLLENTVGLIDASGNLSGLGNVSSSSSTVTGAADVVEAAVRRHAAQLSNIQEWQTELNSALASIGPDGTITGPSLVCSSLTASTVPYLDGGKKLASSAVTPTELGYLSGVSSAVQTQLNGKEPTITAGSTAQYWRGDKTWQTLSTTAVAEGTNLYYTDARARASVSGTAPITYNSGTGAFGCTTAADGTTGCMSGTDHTQLTSNTTNITSLQAYTHDETTTRRQYVRWFDDMFYGQSNNAGSPWAWAGASGTTSPLYNSTIASGHPGIQEMKITATAGRTSSMSAQRQIVLDATVGINSVEFLAKLEAAADATNDYIMQLGFADNITRANTVYAADWTIYRASGVTGASTDFLCHVQNGNPGTANDTYVDSGVAMDTAWHKFKVTHGEGGSAVARFYLDGVQKCGDQTVNLPSTAQLTNINFSLEGVALAAASRSIYVDYMSYLNTLVSSR